VLDAVHSTMNDYRRIRVSPQYRRLRPADTAIFHHRSLLWLRQFIGQCTTPTVVLTHHAPSARSLATRDAEDPVSAADASHLDDVVIALGATLWVHGHTHHNVDYTIGRTRVVSNPRGYPHQKIGFIPDLVVDV
jgi:hypothetical protein